MSRQLSWACDGQIGNRLDPLTKMPIKGDPVSMVISGGASLIGGALSANAASDAADAQIAASQQANATQERMFNQVQQNLQPYMQAGNQGVSSLSSFLSPGGAGTTPFTADTFKQYVDPGYQFQLEQGQQGINNRNAADSGALSGAALKDLVNYNQGMANTAYENAFNRYQTQQGNIFQRLSGLANIGLGAAGGASSAAQNAGNQISANQIGAGNAAASGDVGMANAISGGLTGAGNMYALSSFLGKGGRIGNLIGPSTPGINNATTNIAGSNIPGGANTPLF
jgi:hypothetical protein